MRNINKIRKAATAERKAATAERKTAQTVALKEPKQGKNAAAYIEKVELSDIDLFNKFSNPSANAINIIEDEFYVDISVRGNILLISGEKENVNNCDAFIYDLIDLYKTKGDISDDDLIRLAKMKIESPGQNIGANFYNSVLITPRKKIVAPRTINQKKYVDAIYKNDIVIGVGPAGTGKTYLAMACAVSLFQKKLFDRIILTRPAVEAGEKLGFLPGDISQKINPYLRPLYDALYEMLDFDKVMKLIETDVIEVAPIAFMRGRTLNNSFIILDEAQNATNEQMKMMLTRIGSGSKIVVNGDITQTDLPLDKESGLLTASKILNNTTGIEVVHFNSTDVLRHKLVQNIIKAYETNEISRIPKK
ncbi:MAG: PhoH family protein [Deltaproteobacteria bacterium]|nr:PhoH family protein [Deltaproteobacteria bacterium]